MVYICAKCKFLFERTSEPSHCPSCDNEGVMVASDKERREYMRLHRSQRSGSKHKDIHSGEL